MKFNNDFYEKDVLDIAPFLLGKYLVRNSNSGIIEKYIITETEAYKGENDLACHACKGRTPRTDVMYKNGGHIYVYLIYGLYWMLNIVTGKINTPQAVLIRGIEGYNGPGKLTKKLSIDNSLNNIHINNNEILWIEDNNKSFEIYTGKRIGIDYAGEIWKNKNWRFYINL